MNPKTTAKQRKANPFVDIPRDAQAEILSFFNTPKEWYSLMSTCKQLYDDMNDWQTAWGMENAVFVIHLHKIRENTILEKKIWDKRRHIKRVRIHETRWIAPSENNYSITKFLLELLSDVNATKHDFQMKYGFELTTDLGVFGVTHADLCATQLSADCLELIAEMLKYNKTLRLLDVGRNRIENRGALAIAQMLSVNTSMTSLYIDSCYITTIGFCALADALKLNKSLRFLGFDENSPGLVGIMALVDSLKVNTGITLIELHGLTQDEVNVFAAGLAENSSVQALKIAGVTEMDIAKIAKRGFLKRLRINKSDISDTFANNIAEALKTASNLSDIFFRECTFHNNARSTILEAHKMSKGVKLWGFP